MPKAYDVFVSYAATEKAWVLGELKPYVKAAGLRWHDEHAFDLGVPRILEFERAVADSERIVLVLSRGYRADPAGPFVTTLALSRQLEGAATAIVPVVVDRVHVPPLLAQLDPIAGDAPELLTRIGERLRLPVPAGFEKPGCPYPGLRAVEEGLCGRDQDLAELRRRIAARARVFLIGPSGVGKTSLLRAGLLPALGASAVAMRPGVDPQARLAELVLASGNVLVIDQFEELFTVADPAARKAFFTALARLDGVKVVASLRSDFFSELMESPLWPVPIEDRHELGPLTDAGIRAAITEPAARVGVAVEAGLVARLTLECRNQAGALPLLQETLIQLWARMRVRMLAEADYDGTIVSQLARRADSAVAELSDEARSIARRCLVRMVQFGAKDTRRRIARDGLRDVSPHAELVNRTLEYFVNLRLLSADGDHLELAHEALIGGWPTLVRWLEESRAAEVVRRRLIEKVADWKRQGSLLDAAELVEAESHLREQGTWQELEQLVARSRRRRRAVRIVAAVVVAVIAGAAVIALVARNRARRAETQTKWQLAEQLYLQSEARWTGARDVTALSSLAHTIHTTTDDDPLLPTYVARFANLIAMAPCNGLHFAMDVHRFAFASDATIIAVPTFTGAPVELNLATGARRAIAIGGRVLVGPVLSRDRARAAMITDDPTRPGAWRMAVWETSLGKVLLDEPGTGTPPPRDMAFTAESTRLVLELQPGTPPIVELCVYDLSTKACSKLFGDGEIAYEDIKAFDIGPFRPFASSLRLVGDRIVVTSQTVDPPARELKLISLASGAVTDRRSFPYKPPGIEAVQVSGDERVIATTSREPGKTTVWWWNVETGQVDRRELTGYHRLAAISASGNTVVVVNEEHLTRVRRDEAQELDTPGDPKDFNDEVQVETDDRILWALSSQGHVRKWDLEKQVFDRELPLVETTRPPGGYRQSSLAFTADHRSVYQITRTGDVYRIPIEPASNRTSHSLLEGRQVISAITSSDRRFAVLLSQALGTPVHSETLGHLPPEMEVEIAAVRIADGKLLWSPIPYKVRSLPALFDADAERVLIGLATPTPEGRVSKTELQVLAIETGAVALVGTPLHHVSEAQLAPDGFHVDAIDDGLVERWSIGVPEATPTKFGDGSFARTRRHVVASRSTGVEVRDLSTGEVIGAVQFTADVAASGNLAEFLLHAATEIKPAAGGFTLRFPSGDEVRLSSSLSGALSSIDVATGRALVWPEGVLGASVAEPGRNHHTATMRVNMPNRLGRVALYDLITGTMVSEPTLDESQLYTWVAGPGFAAITSDGNYVEYELFPETGDRSWLHLVPEALLGLTTDASGTTRLAPTEQQRAARELATRDGDGVAEAVRHAARACEAVQPK